MIRAAVAALALLAASASMAQAAEITIVDDKSQPESMAVAPDGTLFVGSASTPFVYRIAKGSTTPVKFIDASAEAPGTFFFGQLVEAETNTLWTCQLAPIANSGTPPKRMSALRSFDLKTGAAKLRWNLPGEASTCNDFVIGPDKALYISDTANAKIYRLARGAQVPELYTEHATLAGIDGITFLGDVMYVNSVTFNKLWRIPVGADGKPGRPVDIWIDAPARGLDGMRAANGKLFLAEGAFGKVSYLTIDGDKAHMTVIKDGLKTPTAVEPAGDVLWFTERATGKIWSVPMPK